GTDTLTLSDTGGTTLTNNIGNTAPTDTLVLAGTQTLNLPNANTDTNPVTLNGATVNLSNATSLGSGTLTLTAGTVQTTTPLTLAELITFSNNGTATIAG